MMLLWIKDNLILKTVGQILSNHNIIPRTTWVNVSPDKKVECYRFSKGNWFCYIFNYNSSVIDIDAGEKGDEKGILSFQLDASDPQFIEKFLDVIELLCVEDKICQ